MLRGDYVSAFSIVNLVSLFWVLCLVFGWRFRVEVRQEDCVEPTRTLVVSFGVLC